MAHLMDDNGYFVPFMKPVVPPLGEIDASLSKQVAFNGDWLPIVLGCLKTMARPETYQSGVAVEPMDASREGQTLLGMIEDYPLPLYNWNIITSVGADYSIEKSGILCSAKRNRVIYVAAMKTGDEIDGTISIGGQGRSVPDGDIVGGNFTVDIYYLPDASKVYVEGSTDCSGTNAPHSGFVDDGHHLFTYSGRDNFSISIDAIALMLAIISINSDYNCAQI